MGGSAAWMAARCAAPGCSARSRHATLPLLRAQGSRARPRRAPGGLPAAPRPPGPAQRQFACGQGSQFAALRFGCRCRDLGIRQSMGSVGGCFDHAVTEGLFATSPTPRYPGLLQPTGARTGGPPAAHPLPCSLTTTRPPDQGNASTASWRGGECCGLAWPYPGFQATKPPRKPGASRQYQRYLGSRRLARAAAAGMALEARCENSGNARDATMLSRTCTRMGRTASEKGRRLHDRALSTARVSAVSTAPSRSASRQERPTFGLSARRQCSKRARGWTVPSCRKRGPAVDGVSRGTVTDLSERGAVLEALQEYDKLGRERFLAVNAFGRSRRYFLRHEGKFYDSKAIAGVAHGI